jgi:uncharacterized protein
MRMRNATPADFAPILALNEKSVQFLSPLTPERLSLLHAQSAYHRVIEVDGRIAAFLLAFREGAAYDSPNYRWFADRYERFLYIDRIVVGNPYQGYGIGKLFYADLLAFARSKKVPRVTCEFDIDPPNERSRRFHESFGFREAGTQFYGPSQKQVSLQVLRIETPESA